MSSAPVTGVAGEQPTVGVEDLQCPGCGGPVTGEPPWLRPAGAGQVPEFSHPDGSALCVDERGRIGEPVECRL